MSRSAAYSSVVFSSCRPRYAYWTSPPVTSRRCITSTSSTCAQYSAAPTRFPAPGGGSRSSAVSHAPAVNIALEVASAAWSEGCATQLPVRGSPRHTSRVARATSAPIAKRGAASCARSGGESATNRRSRTIPLRRTRRAEATSGAIGRTYSSGTRDVATRSIERRVEYSHPPFTSTTLTTSTTSTTSALRHRRVALLSERIVQLLERNRQAHIVTVRSTLRISTRRKNRRGRPIVLPHEPAEIAEAVSGQPEPECALAEHEIFARRLSAGIAERTKSRRRAQRVELAQPPVHISRREQCLRLDEPGFPSTREHDVGIPVRILQLMEHRGHAIEADSVSRIELERHPGIG